MRTHHLIRSHKTSRLGVAVAAAGVAAFALVAATPAMALKYAPVAQHMKADPALPAWHPGKLAIKPKQEFHLVGADVMDQITLGWIQMFRKAYPHLSVTMEARSSGSGAPGLIDGRADAAPVGRELLPAERAAFVKKFGYAPLRIKVATGSVGTLSKTASTVVLVDKNNPISGLTMAQLDAIYSTSRLRGDADISTWGQLGLKGAWAKRPIHLYGLRSPNGIEQYVKMVVMKGGDYKHDIQFVEGEGFTHAFTVAAHDIEKDQPGGLTYAMLCNLTKGTKVVPLAAKPGGPFLMPTLQNIYTHAYPLSRYVYIFVNRPPGTKLDPVVKQFLTLVLSRQGQSVIAKEGVYIPLTPAVAREELKKLN